MRVRIQGPCFIESESPFTVIPIYEPAPKVQDFAESVKAPLPKMQAAPKPKKKPRKKPKGFRRSCVFCGVGYIAHSAKSVFCTDRHRHAYIRAQGYTYPLDDVAKAHLTALRNGASKQETVLDIHAGAEGVEVKARG